MLTAKQVAEQLKAMGYPIVGVTEGDIDSDGEIKITDRVWVAVGNLHDYLGVTADIGNDTFWTPPPTHVNLVTLRPLIDEALQRTTAPVIVHYVPALEKLTPELIEAAARIDDINAAILSLTQVAGITTADVAWMAFAGGLDSNTWPSADHGRRLAALHTWIELERVWSPALNP